MTADALFETPPASPLPPLSEPLYGALDAKWTPWRGAHRPCDHCVKRIHELGVSKAPHPRPATHRRKGPNGDSFLCSEDAQTLRDLDDAVERKHAGRAVKATAYRQPRQGSS